MSPERNLSLKIMMLHIQGWTVRNKINNMHLGKKEREWTINFHSMQTWIHNKKIQRNKYFYNKDSKTLYTLQGCTSKYSMAD